MRRLLDSDSGQTLPLYIWLTGILLFIAFAFFAFAQAASARNGAQSAADAAALAAAQDARDELMDGLELAIGEGGDWIDWLAGDEYTGGGARGAADALAAENDSTVIGFGPTEVNGYPGFRAEIETTYTVGDSIIPGTENQHAKAEATAIVKPRCDVAPSVDPKKAVQFDCDGGESFEIDPDDYQPGDLPDASVLFSVHLAD
ncbi:MULTISPECIES: pilus assembly protein TadG-related protein [Streptomyces]|uniref:pilus assembly protein TadG-related protein n=1 Tax=Streptomyces TaxID=1883 RepID=UPI0022A9AD61|nr:MULTISPECIES: pilus assembly protein TadG-related protein [Streptomyces]UFQ20321.1 pilus assembly protein TadG-related protein [Streptomyces huasconensis]WCL89938.1 pilus assembly protein TadG-related protein [Streptomyces sp. JCM 35825]